MIFTGFAIQRVLGCHRVSTSQRFDLDVLKGHFQLIVFM